MTGVSVLVTIFIHMRIFIFIAVLQRLLVSCDEVYDLVRLSLYDCL